jgi:hypothetical protein
MTSFAILLALIAFSPTPTMAEGGRGGGGRGGGGGNQSGGSQMSGGSQGGSQMSGRGQGGDRHEGVGGDAGTNRGVRSNTGGSGGQGMTPNQGIDARSRSESAGDGSQGRDSWRYRQDNGRWWYWGPDNRWMWYGDDGQWQYYGNERVVQRPILESFSGGPIKIVNPAKSGVTMKYMLDGNAFTIPPGYSQEFQEDRAWVIEFSQGANMDQMRYSLRSGVYKFASTDHGWDLYRSEVPQTVATKPPMPMQTNPSPK